MHHRDYDLPPILVGETDRHDLLVLAMSGTGHTADAADDLLYELDRASVIADRHLPPYVVRMGSTVVASINGGEAQILRLSYPREEGPGCVSILSPVGSALLGLRSGQTIRWTSRDGERNSVTVHSVHNPRST